MAPEEQGSVEGSWELPWAREEKLQRERREGGNKNLSGVLILPPLEFTAELLSIVQGWGQCSGDSFGGLAKEPPGRTNPALFLDLGGAHVWLQSNIQGFVAKVGFATNTRLATSAETNFQTAPHCSTC